MSNILLPPSCLCTPLQLCLYSCIIYQSPSHVFHLPKSLSLISSAIVHHFHIYHIWSCSCYIVIQPYFHDILRNRILLNFDLDQTDLETYASQPNLVTITLMSTIVSDKNKSRICFNEKMARRRIS